MGRPRAEIDGEQVRKLAALSCTQDEIAAFFGVDQSTISRRFASEYALGAAGCKISLRRHQWKAARDGSVPMLIHLGKQYLGQADKTDVTSDGKAVGGVQFVTVIPPEPAPDAKAE